MTTALMSPEAKALRSENMRLKREGKRRCVGCLRIWAHSTAHFHKRGKCLDDRCKRCRNALRRAEHRRRLATDPDYAARVRAANRAFHRRHASDPFYRERWNLAGRRWRAHQRLRNPFYRWSNARAERRRRLKRAMPVIGQRQASP